MLKRGDGAEQQVSNYDYDLFSGGIHGQVTIVMIFTRLITGAAKTLKEMNAQAVSMCAF